MFYWEIITWPKGSLWRWVLPLSNNISVGFNQIVRDISAGQILQSVFVTDFHLDKQTKKWHLRIFSVELSVIWHWSALLDLNFAFDILIVSPTWGGGSPPAPAGHSGSILLRPSQLHSHSGDGFFIDQLPLSNRSFRLWETCGTNQSSLTAGQRESLEQRKHRFMFNSKSPLHVYSMFRITYMWSLCLYFLNVNFSSQNLQYRRSFHAACSKSWLFRQSSE